MRGRKIFGIQRYTLAKRVYAIRFLHVAEGYDDLALGGQRVKSIIKGAKRRGGGLQEGPIQHEPSSADPHRALGEGQRQEGRRSRTSLGRIVMRLLFLSKNI